MPLSFLASHYIDAIPTPDRSRIATSNCFFAVCLLLYFFQRTGLYHSRSFLHRGPMIHRLLLSLFLLVVSFVVLRELSSPHRDFGYAEFILLYAAVTFVIVFAIRRLVFFLDSRFLRSMRAERIAFVGWSFRIGKALKGLAHELLYHQTVVGYFYDRECPDLRPPAELGYQELGSLDDLPRVLAGG